jgi:hypothetical protein
VDKGYLSGVDKAENKKSKPRFLSLGKPFTFKGIIANKTIEAKINLCMTKLSGSTNINPIFMADQFKPHIRMTVTNNVKLVLSISHFP